MKKREIKTKNILFFLLVSLLAFIWRLFLIPTAYHGDLYNNRSWGVEGYMNGFGDFYEREEWSHSKPNQPPVYVYIFTASAAFHEYINSQIYFLNDNYKVFPSSLIWLWEEKGWFLSLKIPGVLGDIILGYLIYLWGLKRYTQKKAILLSAIWFFNPVSWYSTGIWGQTDSILNALGLATVFSLFDRKLIKATILFTLCIMFKVSLLIFAPILLIVVLKEKQMLKIPKMMLTGFLTVVTVGIWFHPKLDFPLWIYNLYTQRIIGGEIGDTTANAFNFWWIATPQKTLDTNTFLFAPARIIGILLFTAVLLLVVKSLLKNYSHKKTVSSLSTVTLASFLFMTRMHERYMYPFFPLTTLILLESKVTTVAYVILSFSHVVNMYHLFWAPGNKVAESLISRSETGLLLSILNVTIFAVLFYKYVKSSTN